MADLNPYWLGRGGETFEFTWSMDSGTARPASEVRTMQGINADRVWIDEWARLFVTGGRRNGKMTYNKTSALRMATGYLRSAKLTADEAIEAVREILGALNVSATVTPFTPKWKPGDVVTVQFDTNYGIPYTYVRGRIDWPGDGVRLSDAQVNAHYFAGSAKPLLQQGGVTFDAARLKP